MANLRALQVIPSEVSDFPLRLLFSENIDALRRRRQTITRRMEPVHVAVGMRIDAVSAGWQLVCPAKIVPAAALIVVSVSKEPLRRLVDDEVYGAAEMLKEGFQDGASAKARVARILSRHRDMTLDSLVTRIEFRHAAPPLHNVCG